MREIKFRGKSIDSGEFVYGFLYIHEPPLQCFDEGKPKEPLIYYIVKTAFADWYMPRSVNLIQVDPNTVSQLVCSVVDKKEIYEGDKVKALNGFIGIVIYNEKRARFEVEGYYDQSADYPDDIFSEGYPEVIGNIHESK